jgi:hypothetical protein
LRENGYYHPTRGSKRKRHKKISTVFKKSEEEIKNIFGINDKEIRVYRSKEERIPILGIVKNGEVIFFSLDNIPGKEDMQMRKKFVLQIRGASNPDFKPGDELTIICMDSVQGYEGNYCVIKKGNELYLKKLTKGLSSKENVIGLMCAHKRITLDIK